MKMRNIGIATAVAVAAAGVWFGRLAWRAHRDLVTLRGRNMPLARVVRSLEWQTWEKIKYDKRLDAKITLNVKDAPLDSVLDLVADRAGARWQKTYAVGATSASLSKLEPVLAGDEKLDAAGWTNIAPPAPELPSDADNVIGAPAAADQLPAPPEGGGPVVMTPDNGGPPPGPMPPGGPRFFRRFVRPDGSSGGRFGGPGGPMGSGIAGPAAGQAITILPDGTADVWSSERIVLETELLAQLGSNAPSEATANAAKQVASAVHGRSRLYYNLAPAPFGMEGPAPGFDGRRLTGGGPHGAGKSGPGPGGGDIVAMMKQSQQQRRLREMSRSPEEQVERARERAGNKARLQTFEQDTKSN